MSGRPVVVTKVGDIPLFLKDRGSALLAEANHPDDFAAKLSWVSEHPQEAERIGENGKLVALEHFNASIEGEKLLDVIIN